MFDVEAYYKDAWSGKRCGDESIIPYINGFEHVILWGASTLGNAIGKKLLACGVKIENYWDIRFDEVKSCNGIEVIAPFSTKKENCLVIVCIGNRVILQRLIKNLKIHDYKDFLYGDYLYMGLLCPFNKDTGVNARRCSCTMECRQVYCHRISNIICGHEYSEEDSIILPSVTLIINQRCSLKCKYCTSYMNEYETAEKKDFPLERICEDIDKFFDMVDVVGTVTVMGGEPFMHPQISDIIAHLCSKKNFGLISIATSGTYPIKEEQLAGLYDPRVNVSFSNYTESITENQIKMFYQNVELLKAKGVCHTVGLFSPEWMVPNTLTKKDVSDEDLIRQKEICVHWHQIKNGKIHPCDYAMSLYNLHIADYESDYIDLTKEWSRKELRKAFMEYVNRPFYESCRHDRITDKKRLLTAKAAEQGYIDMKVDW